MSKTPLEMRITVRALHRQGTSLRTISRMLKMSRKTVRHLVQGREADGTAGGETVNALDQPCDVATLNKLTAAFEQARGNVVRVQELLAEDGITVAYSTLTRWVRAAGLRAPPRRSGTYDFPPGAEMQHDTSPHKVGLDGRTVTAQCAGLVLAWSRRLFIQYYPRFTRFEAKAFLLDAVRFMEGACSVCTIDNSSVILAAGSGADAVVAPEMRAFARTLGFHFQAHQVGHPDRKGRIERPFSYVEGNFLAGRSFADYADLNRQALAWCRDVANAKPKQVLGQSPEAAWLVEKPHLQPLPDVLPPVYALLDREVDMSGFVSVDTNRYSVPERFVGQSVTVYKYPSELRICQRDRTLAVHARLIGQRDGKVTLAGHHTVPKRQARGPVREEALLTGHHPSLDRYVAALKQRRHGWGRRALRRLLEMKRTYPEAPLIAAIEQALHYGLFDLGRLETLILSEVSGSFFALERGVDGDA